MQKWNISWYLLLWPAADLYDRVGPVYKQKTFIFFKIMILKFMRKTDVIVELRK